MTNDGCEECGADCLEQTRPCATCGITVRVCLPCATVVVVELERPYVCAFCRRVQRRAEPYPVEDVSAALEDDVRDDLSD